MSSIYTIKQGETIGDVVINSTGTLSNWNVILNANPLIDTWTPDLTASEAIIIPDTVTNDLNALKQMQAYPLCNYSVNDINTQISNLMALIT